jgi:hypothetical protein
MAHVRNPDPVLGVALETGLHPDHPLQTTYGHEIAAAHVAFANRVANSIRGGGVTVPADPSAPSRNVASGDQSSNWFSVGGAQEHRSKTKYPEISTPLGKGPDLAPDARTGETRAALSNIVRTQNENLSRQITNRANEAAGISANAPRSRFPMLEVGGWSERGQAVHDVANVTTYKETPKGGQKRQAEKSARQIAGQRGERAYFDASTGDTKDPLTGKVLPD